MNPVGFQGTEVLIHGNAVLGKLRRIQGSHQESILMDWFLKIKWVSMVGLGPE